MRRYRACVTGWVDIEAENEDDAYYQVLGAVGDLYEESIQCLDDVTDEEDEDKD